MYKNQDVENHHSVEHLIIEFEIVDAEENDLDNFDLRYEFLTKYTNDVIFSLESDKTGAVEFTDRDKGLGIVKVHKNNFSGLEGDYKHRLIADNGENHIIFKGNVEILS